MRGIAPQWSDFSTFRQVGSTLGKLVEVDWNSLLTSYFEMVRIKIKCRDPKKISQARIMEFQDKLFVISFKTEGIQIEGSGGDEPYDGDDNDLLDDPGAGEDQLQRDPNNMY